MPGTFFLQPRVSDPGQHHRTCVAAIWQEAHGLLVRWWSRTCREACRESYLAVSFKVGGGENAPSISGARAPRNFTPVRGKWIGRSTPGTNGEKHLRLGCASSGITHIFTGLTFCIIQQWGAGKLPPSREILFIFPTLIVYAFDHIETARHR